MNKRIVAIIIGLVLIAALAVVGQVFNIDEIEVRFSEPTDDYTAEDVASICGIEKGKSILSVKDSYARESLLETVKTGRLQLDSIDRVYPNKVVINIDVLQETFLVHTEDGKIVPSDVDFLIKEKIPYDDSYSRLIDIRGVVISNTLNVYELKFVRSLAYAFYGENFDDEGLLSFVETVEFGEDGEVVVSLRNYDNVTFNFNIAVESNHDKLVEALRLKLNTFFDKAESERHDMSL